MGIHGCVAADEQQQLIQEVNKIAFAGERYCSDKIHDFLVKHKSVENGKCYVADLVFQGSIEDAYKSRYELIFEGTEYVLFVSDASFGKQDQLKYSIEDVAEYDPRYMKTTKK